MYDMHLCRRRSACPSRTHSQGDLHSTHMNACAHALASERGSEKLLELSRYKAQKIELYQKSSCVSVVSAFEMLTQKRTSTFSIAVLSTCHFLLPSSVQNNIVMSHLHP